jgi:hypothetical protein
MGLQSEKNTGNTIYSFFYLPSARNPMASLCIFAIFEIVSSLLGVPWMTVQLPVFQPLIGLATEGKLLDPRPMKITNRAV